jgi:hypothetical protein
LCFQTAGIWEMGADSRMGLPLHIDQLIVLSGISESAEHAQYAVVTRPDLDSFNADIVDAMGNRYLQLKGYRTVALPGAIDPVRLKLLQAAMAPELATA